MEGKCGRCGEKPSEIECSDCSGKDEKSGPIPLCAECSEILHVGFMKDHCIETNDVKEKRNVFKENVKNYMKKEQVLKRSLVEIKHAYQNVSSRSENNKYTIQQALVAINQVLKKKEEELSSCMAGSGTDIKAKLADTEKTLEERLKKLQSCHERAEKIATAEASQFITEHSKIGEEIDALLAEQVSSDIPCLNPPICADALDVSKVLESLNSFGSDWLADQKKEERPQLSDCLQEIKEGNQLNGYVESRMDARGCFWVCQDLVEGITNSLDDLSFEIRKDIISQGWEDLTVTEGSLCVAQYHQDNRWYRARVEKLKEHTAEVRWLDYAHGDEVQLSHIQPLRERFSNIPYQGLECSLFEDMSEEMPRQARWEFSDHAANVLLHCTIVRKLPAVNGGKVPVYLVKLDQTGEEKFDIAECVWNKAQDSRSSKGPIAYRDVRLMHEDSKDIKVIKEVVNSSKKPSEETGDSTNQEGEGEQANADEQNGDGEEKAGDGEENKEDVATAGKTDDADEEDGGKDAVEGAEDLSLAQKLEKQGDSAESAPEQIDPVTGATRMSPMAFIAAHGSYNTAINGSSGLDPSNMMQPYATPHSQIEAAWYQHYALPGIGVPAGAHTFPLVPGLTANGEAYGMVPGSHLGVHVATPLTAEGIFWAARVRGHVEEIRFRKLMHDISSPSDNLSVNQLHRGKMVCAYPADLGHWCRAKVEEVSNDVVRVRLCDFGSLASVDCTQLKALEVTHGVYPFQACECSLAKENLTSFAESSRQLFHHLTTGKLATAKVDAVSDFVVYVSLFLSGESGEVIDVVAELARNEKAVNVESKSAESAPTPQGTLSNGQTRPASKAGFSPFLKETCRNSPHFVADVERDLANLIAGVNETNQSSQTYTFPPMLPEQRAFVHELAEAYSLQSDSRGQEPSRQVIVTAQRGRSSVPCPALSEVCQGEPRPVPGLMEDQQSDRDHRYSGGNVREDQRGCFTCGEMGHRKSNCPKNRNRERDGRQRQSSSWWGDSGRKQGGGRKGGGGRRN